MSDSQQNPPGGENKTLTESVADLPPNIAAGLAAILPPFSGVAFLLLDRKRENVRFHAMQNLVLGAAGFLAVAALKILGALESIPLVGALFGVIVTILSVAVGLLYLCVYAAALLQAFLGNRWEIPHLGPLARKILA